MPTSQTKISFAETIERPALHPLVLPDLTGSSHSPTRQRKLGTALEHRAASRLMLWQFTKY